MILPVLTNIRIFSLMALTSLIQLGMCIHSEYLRCQIMTMMMTMMRKRFWYLTMINFRQKSPSCWKACRVTTQKMLYFLTFVASRFLFSKSTWLSPLCVGQLTLTLIIRITTTTSSIIKFLTLLVSRIMCHCQFFGLIPIFILLIIFILINCITLRSLRAIYFASPQLGSSMSASLMSAYYPVDHFVVTYT